MNDVYSEVLKFKRKYPLTVAWRLKRNSAIVQKHMTPDEKIIYAFAAQKNPTFKDIFSTAVVVLTDKRILIGRKRVVFGYFVDSVTPQMFNDLNVKAGLIWGNIYIDTVKEFITLSNIDKNALAEIETSITSYMMEVKQKYPIKNESTE